MTWAVRMDENGPQQVWVDDVPELRAGHAACDRCGSTAWVRVALRPGQWLDFCRHHFLRHHAAIAAAGYGWDDQTRQMPWRQFRV